MKEWAKGEDGVGDTRAGTHILGSRGSPTDIDVVRFSLHFSLLSPYLSPPPSLPPPRYPPPKHIMCTALDYYVMGDLYMFDEFQTSRPVHSR